MSRNVSSPSIGLGTAKSIRREPAHSCFRRKRSRARLWRAGAWRLLELVAIRPVNVAGSGWRGGTIPRMWIGARKADRKRGTGNGLGLRRWLSLKSA